MIIVDINNNLQIGDEMILFEGDQENNCIKENKEDLRINKNINMMNIKNVIVINNMIYDEQWKVKVIELFN